MVLRKIRPFASSRDELTRGLHNEELYGLYFSSNVIRVIVWRCEFRWTCSTCGGMRGAYRVLMGRPESRRTLGRPRRRSEDNIKTNLKEIGWEFVDWIDLAQDMDSVALMWAQYWTFGFHKMGGISWIAEELLESQEWFCYVEWSN